MLTNIERLDLPIQGQYLQCLNERSTNQLCCAISEILHQRGNLKLPDSKTQEVRNLLQPYKRDIKIFISPKSSHLKRKRRLRKQTGGAIFSILVSTLLPLLISQIISAVKKK